jgi:hypothetical protein
MNWKLGLIVAVVVAVGGLLVGALFATLTFAVLLAIVAIAVLAAFVMAAIFRVRSAVRSSDQGPAT